MRFLVLSVLTGGLVAGLAIPFAGLAGLTANRRPTDSGTCRPTCGHRNYRSARSSRALARVGECLGLLGHRAEAITKLSEAISLMEQLQLSGPQARSLEILAAVLADDGRAEESRRVYVRAAEVFEAIGWADASRRCHDLATTAPDPSEAG